MDKHILVVGGAGYIGAHMCKYLSAHGYTPLVLDNLVYGHREAVQWGPLVEGSIENTRLLDEVFSKHDISGVMHFAAYAYVGESVEDPAKYYRNNVAATLNLLEAMVRHRVDRFIFSSSCATYGEPVRIPMAENHPQIPINPYGRTKLMVEQVLDDFEQAYGLRSVCLRYFNAAGADPDGRLGEDHTPETHLIPLVLQTALGQREKIHIFGDDYDTPDGTCIRDYIHVEDLAQAHLAALERLLDGTPGDKFNLGNGEGYSVKAVIDTARRITGKPIPARIDPRRPGDPPSLIGSSQKAMRDLKWKPAYPDLDTIIETAWRWHQRHPGGFGR
ncbi:MAG: UDP-glucose 4-epimerase GalE [Thermodesulfobacteriota bacterium]